MWGSHDMWGSHESMICGSDDIYLTLGSFSDTNPIFPKRGIAANRLIMETIPALKF